MDWLALPVAAFTCLCALPVRRLLFALAPRFPSWIPGAVALTAAVILVARNPRPEYSFESAPWAYAELGFALQNGIALGFAIVGAISLGVRLRSWRRRRRASLLLNCQRPW